MFSGTLWILTMVTVMGNSISLPACPSSPNCVSSQALDNHFIEPIRLGNHPFDDFQRLAGILNNRPDATVLNTQEENNIIRVEFRTTIGFVDDAIFALDAENQVVHIRSASRLGYWDLGKNRRRMEEIRREFNKQ